MRDELRAGIAIYNAGHYHTAHDAWEDRWLRLDRNTDDERLLHGLIQFTAAVHHARTRNWEGATGLAASALSYLDGLPPTYREVELDSVRAFLRRLLEDPEHVDRAEPPPLTHEGVVVTRCNLLFEPAAMVAGVFAEASPSFDERVVERAIDYARADLDDGNDTSPLVTLVMDFARDDTHREVAYRRLGQHVDRRLARDRDVDGLFEPESNES